MQAFRTLLIAMTIIILVMTAAAVWNGGLDLLTHYFGAIIALTWQGQFNVDFACYLVLSGVWMTWRSGFTTRGVALGVLTPPLGILFLAPYLLYLIGKSGRDVRKLLLGVHA